MGIFSFLFGGNNIKQAIRRGAVIIDVRTPVEFDRGKVPGSINIPVDRIRASIERIKAMNRPVIVCCNTGSRSSEARGILKSAGLKEVYYGGNWESVLRQIR
jgi:phage shock protein E